MVEIEIARILRLAGLTEAHDNRSDHQNALRQTGFWGAQGAGCIFFAKSTKRFLIAHRSPDVQEGGDWGVWGGAIDKGENPEEAVKREVKEEAGYHGHFDLIPIFIFSSGSFRYSNFIAVVDEEFTPILDWETQGYKWCEFGKWPKPMHFGLKAVLQDADSVAIIKKLIAGTPL